VGGTVHGYSVSAVTPSLGQAAHVAAFDEAKFGKTISERASIGSWRLFHLKRQRRSAKMHFCATGRPGGRNVAHAS